MKENPKPTVVVRRQKPTNIVTSTVRRSAAELFKEGLGYVKAAAILKVSPHPVRDWKRQYVAGKFNIRVSKNQKVYDEATKAAAIALLESGLSWDAFEKETGIPRATCARWIRLEKERTGS